MFCQNPDDDDSDNQNSRNSIMPRPCTLSDSRLDQEKLKKMKPLSITNL